MFIPSAARVHYGCVMFVRILQGLVEVGAVTVLVFSYIICFWGIGSKSCSLLIRFCFFYSFICYTVLDENFLIILIYKLT